MPKTSTAPHSHLTLNYGLRWDTTFGLFEANGRSQAANAALQTIAYPQYAGSCRTTTGNSSDLALGLIYAPGKNQATVLRAGFGMFFNDLAQNGWVPALVAVNGSNANRAQHRRDHRSALPHALRHPCHCRASNTPSRRTGWPRIDYTHETGMHGYRAYGYPDVTVFRSDNRSSYDGLAFRVQGNVSKRSA